VSNLFRVWPRQSSLLEIFSEVDTRECRWTVPFTILSWSCPGLFQSYIIQTRSPGFCLLFFGLLNVYTRPPVERGPVPFLFASFVSLSDLNLYLRKIITFQIHVSGLQNYSWQPKLLIPLQENFRFSHPLEEACCVDCLEILLILFTILWNVCQSVGRRLGKGKVTV
jgi:hypothetical protein